MQAGTTGRGGCVGSGGARPPRFTRCSQIQKLAGKIFKQFKMPIFPLHFNAIFHFVISNGCSDEGADGAVPPSEIFG